MYDTAQTLPAHESIVRYQLSPHATEMHPALDNLRLCADITALRSALHSMCSGTGVLVRLDILPTVQEGRQRALCFLRMETSAQEEQLVQQFGFGRFASDLFLIVELVHCWPATAAYAWSSESSPTFQQVTDAKHPPHLGHTA